MDDENQTPTCFELTEAQSWMHSCKPGLYGVDAHVSFPAGTHAAPDLTIGQQAEQVTHWFYFLTSYCFLLKLLMMILFIKQWESL